MSQIDTLRLIIRRFSPADAEDLQEILGDAETMENCELPYDLEKTKQFLHSFCIERKGALAAVHRQTQKVIGYILFHETEPGIFEIGWFFNRHWWRQGYAYEACKAVMDFAFRQWDASRIFAETIDMVKSLGLMKKLGMTLEEIQCGQMRDLHVYSLSREGWEDLVDAICTE